MWRVWCINDVEVRTVKTVIETKEYASQDEFVQAIRANIVRFLDSNTNLVPLDWESHYNLQSDIEVLNKYRGSYFFDYAKMHSDEFITGKDDVLVLFMCAEGREVETSKQFVLETLIPIVNSFNLGPDVAFYVKYAQPWRKGVEYFTHIFTTAKDVAEGLNVPELDGFMIGLCRVTNNV